MDAGVAELAVILGRDNLILKSLLDLLIEKGVITAEESKQIIDKACNKILKDIRAV